MLIGLYCLYVFLVTLRHPEIAPPGVAALTSEPPSSPLWREIVIAIGLPIILIGLVLASISFGVATPSEGGAIGVTSTLLLAASRSQLTAIRLKTAMSITGILCASIIFLLFGASFFTLVFRGFDGHLWIEGLLSHLPAGQIGFVVIVNIAVFLLAFFLDFFEIAFIVLPLVVPIAHKLGIDMVWLTVLFAVNLQTSFMHPPFGIALYNLRSITPRTISTSTIYWGAVPFIGIQFLVLAMLILFPKLVLKEPAQLLTPVEIRIDLPEFMPPVIVK